jgi:hypothetical protein
MKKYFMAIVITAVGTLLFTLGEQPKPTPVPLPNVIQQAPAEEVKPVEVPIAPTPVPEPVIEKPIVYAVGCELYRSLISQYSWNVNVAMAIMQAESGCNPNAANWTDSHSTCKGSFGLFQIACFSGQVYDPAQNISIAYQKYQARGWQPWGAYTNGSYLKYL